MFRRAVLKVLALIALVVMGTMPVGALSAQAAVDPLVVSPDGTSYANNLPTSLFAGALIVPGKSITRTFWVKNQSTETGNLAVALRDITGTDGNLLAALSIRAVAGPTTGTTKQFSAANPCISLVSGVTLAAGAVMQVDVRLSLSSSLSGKTSQGSIGGFKIPLTLTSTDVPAPSGCNTTVVTPPSGGGGGGTNNPGGTGGPGTIGTVVIEGAATGTVPGTVDNGPLSGIGGKGYVRSEVVIPNTGRFWQELDIIGYLIAMVLGGIFAWRWRRRDREEEAYA
jgi:hypothetical protein